jgi:class III poly(R)-hydroxyalkanoic acid synthase PhaE subunit
MSGSTKQPGGMDFEALARQYYGAWGDSLRQGGAGGTDPGEWKQVLDWWAQLLPERGPGPADDALHRFREQAGGWYGTMQQVASQFAGRDASSADVAQAWRDAVMGQGKGESLLNWMLQGAQGSTGAGGGMDDVVAVLEQWQERLAPWLQSPAFGPAREHQARWQRLLQAQQAFQGHSKEYVAQIQQALDAAFALFEQRLAEHESPGSQLTSARAMFDLWIEVAEEAYAKVALSERFQQVFASLGNAQMRLRSAVQHEVEQLSERVGLPTRTEMDAAHKRIAELERQLRRLQASVEPLLRTPASPAASDEWADAVQPAAKVVPRARKRASRATSAVAPTAKPAKAAKPAKPRVRKPRA